MPTPMKMAPTSSKSAKVVHRSLFRLVPHPRYPIVLCCVGAVGQTDGGKAAAIQYMTCSRPIACEPGILDTQRGKRRGDDQRCTS